MAFGRHGRFMAALALGALVAAGSLGLPLTGSMRALLAAVTVFVVYIGLTLWMAGRVTPDDLRRHAEQSDEGLVAIIAITMAVVGVSLGSLLLLLNDPAGVSWAEAVLALVSVPLGWAMVHVLAAFHYAAEFYGRAKGSDQDAGGLSFPGCTEPGAWDFLYFSLVIGMTAQVSDVVVETTGLRRAVLLHSVGAFFYNTVLLAVAVNAALALTPSG